MIMTLGLGRNWSLVCLICIVLAVIFQEGLSLVRTIVLFVFASADTILGDDGGGQSVAGVASMIGRRDYRY